VAIKLIVAKAQIARAIVDLFRKSMGKSFFL